MDSIAATIDAARTERGWTVQQLAANAGVHVTTCRQLLQEERCNLHTLHLLADALDLDVCLRPRVVESRDDRRRRQWREYKARQRARPQPSTEACGQPDLATDTGGTVQIGRSVGPDMSSGPAMLGYGTSGEVAA